MPGVEGFDNLNAVPPVETDAEQPMTNVDVKTPEDLQNLLKKIEG